MFGRPAPWPAGSSRPRVVPSLAEAFAAGLVSREHIDAAVSAVAKLPERVLSEPVLPLDRLNQVPAAPATPDPTPGGRPDAESAPESMIPAGEAVDRFLGAQARQRDSWALSVLAKHLREALDPDDHDGFDPDAVDRRGLTHTTDGAGMVVGNFQLDAVGGLWFTTAMDHFSAPDPARTEPAEDGTSVTVRDTRTAAQRRADALTLICRLALGTDQTGTAKGGEPPRIVVHTGIEDVVAARHAEADTPPSTLRPEPQPDTQPEPGPIPEPDPTAEPAQGVRHSPVPGTGVRPLVAPGRRKAWSATTGLIGSRLLERLICDSVLQKVLLSTGGAVLDLGQDTRTISRAQRRALNARDRGCVIPGCLAPAQWCEGHHVVWWRHDGPTDLDNLALVCGRCHTLVHLGIWDLVMLDGIPWARPPSWTDPHQRLIRNTHHDAVDQSHVLGTQLRLALETAARPSSNQSSPARPRPHQSSPTPSSPARSNPARSNPIRRTRLNRTRLNRTGLNRTGLSRTRHPPATLHRVPGHASKLGRARRRSQDRSVERVKSHHRPNDP